MKYLKYASCAALLALLAMPLAQANEESKKAREIYDNHRHGVVTVELTITQKFSMQGMPSQESESKIEATGTVIGEDGLTVLALSSTDPSSLVRNMMAGTGRDFQMDTVVADVKILRHDNTEVPAQVILRDNNLDLAFVRPTERQEEPFDYVDFTDSGNPEILDNVVALNRLGRVANRAHSAAFERVEAVVERPRRFYIPGSDATTTATGSPAFTLDGRPVGVFVIRSIRDTGGGSSMFGGNPNMTAIILPARDILESAEQVPPFGEEPAADAEAVDEAEEDEAEADEEDAEEDADEGDDEDADDGDGDEE